jgi:hypothetical protein
MVAWSALLVPILLSTVLVFFASSLIHMVLKWHNPDYRKVGNEEGARAALRGLSPGQYILPHCLEGQQMKDPEMVRRYEEGPVAVIWVRPNGKPQIGAFLGKWVVYILVVSFFAGYMARATLGPGSAYLNVFQVVGASAWLAYAWASPADSIWAGKPWVSTARTLVDGFVYACLTAGSFAWLWPA